MLMISLSGNVLMLMIVVMNSDGVSGTHHLSCQTDVYFPDTF